VLWRLIIAADRKRNLHKQADFRVRQLGTTASLETGVPFFKVISLKPAETVGYGWGFAVVDDFLSQNVEIGAIVGLFGGLSS
jgi:hypothetical protein